MSDKAKIAAIQAVLGTTPDGIWGPKTQAALEAALGIEMQPEPSAFRHTVFASSFADPRDVEKFIECKKRGGTDEECFKVGDNAIGAGALGKLSTAKGTGPCCALPPELIQAKWGSVSNGKGKRLKCIRDANGSHFETTLVLKDTMPHLHNLANRARIDINYDGWEALGATSQQILGGMMEEVTWWWLE